MTTEKCDNCPFSVSLSHRVEKLEMHDESFEKRITKLERNADVMNTKIEQIEKICIEIKNSIENIERKPAETWQLMMNTVITVVLTIGITSLMYKFISP